MLKKPLGYNVYEAAQKRIKQVFDDFPKIYLSFSGGKDSGVMLHLVMDEAIKRNRKIGLLIVDLEGQYKLTIDYIASMIELYKDYLDVYWVCLPLHLRNAVSQFEPQWICWDDDKKPDWIRQPPEIAITDKSYFPFFKYGMEFEEFVPAFGHWYAQGELCACFVGIRTDESLNRFRTIAREKSRFENYKYTTWMSKTLYNVYPIYDWKTSDIWIYNGKFSKPYNKLYDRMHQAGLSIHQARICQPYGDDQRRGLWLFHIIEPETWSRVVARVNGANQGALYVQESGNVLGNMKVTKPEHLNWQQFAYLLLDSLPPQIKNHYENKIAVYLKWYQDRGYMHGIPDEGAITDKKTPSWTRICKALLRNDYWCKGLSFSQHKTGAYEKYTKLMKKRRQEWKILTQI
jgi:predicted phosphoadenosine phosphosulfate sulfurtransferase